ncbi:hypothetical protein [Pontibacter harenae]|uniref:hypothetical protein n=1 Tax=Pontibacter harenae TaxID=2894083 RepID=UPI001E2B432D|nr:hypothetical protein [Pontibacter harenae]MCC9166699.1 hypothetical protein [Pontibacter harenae]
MIKREEKVIKYLERFNNVKEHLQVKYKKEFPSWFLSSLLGHHFDSDDVHRYLIANKNLESIDLESILDRKIALVIGSFEFDSTLFDSILSDNIEKARIRDNGRIWIIHNDDKDPKPSLPHAHDYNLNLKLHLGTGEYFRKNRRLGKLDKKEFERLKLKIAQAGIDLTQVK